MLKKPAIYLRVTLAALLVTTLFAGCDARDPDSLIASGKDYLAKNDSKAAVIQFKNALQKNPNSRRGTLPSRQGVARSWRSSRRGTRVEKGT